MAKIPQFCLVKKEILIVDDDPDIGALLKRYLEKNGYAVNNLHSGMEALKQMATHPPHLLLLDYRLPDFSGEEVLEKVMSDYPAVKVIIITGYGDVKTAIKTIKKGAFDFVTKPIRPDDILLRVQEAFEPSQTTSNAGSKNVKSKKSKSKGGAAHSDFISGNSESFKRIIKNAELVAPTEMSVMILGETGTGKEYIAKKIHELSNRNGEPFEAVDCGALPENLSGSTLFGHVKGAFTGAASDKPGSFELAVGGTLFLDEIGNLSYENQMRLLRVLEERTLTRLGDTKIREVDVRIISATHDDLLEKVQKGKFREDLYHRINEFKIEITPIRQRQADIKLFARHFLDQANKELNKNILGFEDKALGLMLKYPWYGNLRELKNTVKRTVLLEQKELINADTLPQEMILSIDDYSVSRHGDGTAETLKAAVERAEKQAIIKAFKETGGNKSDAAKLLDVDRKTLYNKLSRYNIEV